MPILVFFSVKSMIEQARNASEETMSMIVYQQIGLEYSSPN
jgi:hypothetical protein